MELNENEKRAVSFIAGYFNIDEGAALSLLIDAGKFVYTQHIQGSEIYLRKPNGELKKIDFRLS